MKKNFNFVLILLLIAFILFSLYKNIFTIKEGGRPSKWSTPPPPPPPREVINKLNRLFEFKNLDRNEIIKKARELTKYIDDNNGKYAVDWYTVNYR